MLVKAQSNFRPGFIITNEMDTISGLIDFRSYEMNARICRFRLPDIGRENIYHPGDIYGYRFTDDGKYYVSKDIEIESKQEKVFLEYLIQGIISLLFYPGEESDYYFFQDESGRMNPVTKRDKVILDEKTGKRFISEDNIYKGAISYLFKDSRSLSKAAFSLPFEQSKMIDLTKKYHDEMCTTGEECIIFQTKPDKYTKTKVSVYAGMQILTYKISSLFLEKNLILSLIREFNSILPEVGVQLNFSIPRKNQSISLQVDVSLANFMEKQKVRLEPQHAQLEITGLVVSEKIGPKYIYHKGSIRPLLEGGFMMNRLFVSPVYTYNAGYQYTRDVVVKDFLCPNMIGFYAGTGFDYQLKKDNAITFRVGYNDSQVINSWKRKYKDIMTSWDFKLGYAF